MAQHGRSASTATLQGLDFSRSSRENLEDFTLKNDTWMYTSETGGRKTVWEKVCKTGGRMLSETVTLGVESQARSKEGLT